MPEPLRRNSSRRSERLPGCLAGPRQCSGARHHGSRTGADAGIDHAAGLRLQNLGNISYALNSVQCTISFIERCQKIEHNPIEGAVIIPPPSARALPFIRFCRSRPLCCRKRDPFYPWLMMKMCFADCLPQDWQTQPASSSTFLGRRHTPVATDLDTMQRLVSERQCQLKQTAGGCKTTRCPGYRRASVGLIDTPILRWRRPVRRTERPSTSGWFRAIRPGTRQISVQEGVPEDAPPSNGHW